MNKVQCEMDNLLTVDKPIDIAGLTTANQRDRVGSLNQLTIAHEEPRALGSRQDLHRRYNLLASGVGGYPNRYRHLFKQADT
jgi:hypothetical protein